MSTADQATASGSEPLNPVGPISEMSIEYPVSHRQRVAGLLTVVTVAFLPSIVASVFRGYREPISSFSDAYIQFRYFNSLIVELTSLALLAYVMGKTDRSSRISALYSDCGTLFTVSSFGRPRHVATDWHTQQSYPHANYSAGTGLHRIYPPLG